MDPRNLLIDDYVYELPEERIAKYPLTKRDESKLLVYRNGLITEDIYYNLDQYIEKSSLLVFNNTRVIEARLKFQKPTGAGIELFCLEPADTYPDITSAMMQRENVLWKCLVGGAKKWKNERLSKSINGPAGPITLTATKMSKLIDGFLVEFRWEGASSFAEVLHYAGSVPLPPYLKRDAEESDKERYQTIYARYDGSVAAPTAGLHFTERVFQKLDEKNIDRDFITLHVGAGTFKPVKSVSIGEHEMHAEWFEVKKEIIHDLLELQQPRIAVGTTSLRTLESLYWLGVKAIDNPQITPPEMRIDQWDVYMRNASIPLPDALGALLDWMTQHEMSVLYGQTRLIIAPGYDTKVVDAIITNFHQPRSTLLLLVAAMVGEDWKKIYKHALANDFRFLSYGDGSLLYKK